MEMTTPQLIKLNHSHRVVGMLATMRTSTSILSGQHLSITNLIRAVECLLFLAMASRLTLREFLSDLAITILSPRFGFFLGNAMVLTLFLKKSSFSDSHHRGSRKINVAAVHKQNPQANRATAAGSKPSSPRQSTGMLSSPRRAPTSTQSPAPSVASRIAAATVPASPEMMRTRCYRRINSEKVLEKRQSLFLSEEEKKDEQLVLRRTKTETRLLRRTKTETRLAGRDDQIHAMRRGEGKAKIISNGDLCCMMVEKQQHYPEDHMSRDEFRRTIDDFITWKQNYLREEDDQVEEI